MAPNISGDNRSLIVEWTYIAMIAEPQADEDAFCACDAEECAVGRAL